MQEETESDKAPKPVSVGGLGNVPVAEQQNEYHGWTSRTETLLSLDVNCSFLTCPFLTHSDRIFVAKLDFLRWAGADKVHLYPSHIRGSIIIIRPDVAPENGQLHTSSCWRRYSCGIAENINFLLLFYLGINSDTLLSCFLRALSFALVCCWLYPCLFCPANIMLACMA